MLIHTGVADVSAMIDNDALVAASSADHLATPMGAHFDGGALGGESDCGPGRKRKPPALQIETRPTKLQKQAPAAPRQIVNGCYVTNGKGHRICEGFQNGSCTKMKDSRCIHDVNAVHCCNKCLGNNHGGAHPSKCPAKPKAKAGKAKGKGKGKGEL